MLNIVGGQTPLAIKLGLSSDGDLMSRSRATVGCGLTGVERIYPKCECFARIEVLG